MIWKPKRLRRSSRNLPSDVTRRAPRPQQLERRELLAADPIHVGVVYLETDYLESDNDVGSDSKGDRFLLSFSGGAADTELQRLRISTDKDGDGISIGDPIFDTQIGHRGKGGAHDFQIVKILTSDGRTATAEASVSDGGQELILNLQNFRAGDRLEFTLDVDEVLRNSLDLAVFNDRLDVITSGQEFQDSVLEAVFEAPHYESTTADAIFLNDYGSPNARYGLNLPPDEGVDLDSRPNRSAAAIGSATQTPKPVAISGTVWLDNNLDAVWQNGEAGLADIELTLLAAGADGIYSETGFRTRTGPSGRYEFPSSLKLEPGEYRVAQTQPEGLFSVAAIPGRIGSLTTGVVSSVDVLSAIQIPLGDTEAIEMNFAEAAPASIGGFVYRDDNDNGRRESGEAGIAGVTVRLVPIDTIAAQSPLTTTSNAAGGYSFQGLAPGVYEIIEATQPSGFVDGTDAAGKVDGTVVGTAQNPGDAIVNIRLGGGDVGLDYNFGELALGELSGQVFLAAPGEDCGGIHSADSDQPLGGVVVELQDPDGNVLSRVTTTPTGKYQFDSVRPGTYRVVQYTPSGLLDGQSHVGSIDGIQSGIASDGMMTRQIIMTPGGVGLDYNFCEIAPATLSGFVYHDQTNDGVFDGFEQGIAGVNLALLDENGTVIVTTLTDADGRYEFAELPPGTYQLQEDQPSSYFDGRDTTGRIGGVTVGEVRNDRIGSIVLPQGMTGIDYNFGELSAASLSGSVHADLDGDCIRDDDEAGLQGVMIRLLDENNQQVASTVTNSDGIYRFSGLAPGRYSVVQDQPEGFFDGGTKAGSRGGQVAFNRISQIDLGSGIDATDYDFCEQPPASLAGTVHLDHDGDCVQDDDEPGIAGVAIELRDAAGTIVASTLTDSDGHYRFEGLRGGQHTVVQIQPAGFFDGASKAGSEGGQSGSNRISGIELGPGVDATDYDFCEQSPASLAGSVHVDSDGDCQRDLDEAGIAGVTIELRDASGARVATARTDADGNYRFDGLRGGEYTVFEVQPPGYFQGGQALGSSGGTVLGVDLMSVSLDPGESAVDYLFCEYEPGSISGTVWSDQDQDQILDDGEDPISEVTIKLVDENGLIVKTTKTDIHGRYTFDQLPPGVFGLAEQQPDGYFHGGQRIGDRGGNPTANDVLLGIEISSGIAASGYNFPEIPPAAISGYVFIDGQSIESERAIAPEELRLYRDGVFTGDDTPIAGVRIELRGPIGEPLSEGAFLTGNAAVNSVVTTDVNGFYLLDGLRPGTYTIFQTQPEDVVDSIDTAGTSGGLAVNAADLYTEAESQLIAAIDGTDTYDALLAIELDAGIESTLNNFSEIVVTQPPVDPPLIAYLPVRTVSVDDRSDPGVESFARKQIPFAPGQSEIEPTSRFIDEVDVVTWHLSVINGGYPRGTVSAGKTFKQVAIKKMRERWSEGEHSEGKWKLLTMEGEVREASAEMTLGAEDAVALMGDFDGDGDDEAAIYVAGEWFVDLNGNGVWDAGDLWILLGTEMDRPVVGDWDGDGKDDIGIFGRKWERDLRRVKLDAGLPDPSNRSRRFLESRKMLGLVSVKLRGQDRERLLRRGNEGDLRADAVDHVFQFGENVDTPISGDWNGDGIDQIGTFRGGTWLLDTEGDGRRTKDEVTFEFGQPGDRPIVGDFNGDGIDEVGVIRGNRWIIDSDGDRRLTAADQHIDLPPQGADSQPIAGDWNGDGKDEPGYYNRAG